MYYQLIFRIIQKFTELYHYTPEYIIMNVDYYRSLSNEMYDDQLYFLIKTNSIMGLHIDFDTVDNFIVIGNDDDKLSLKEFKEMMGYIK